MRAVTSDTLLLALDRFSRAVPHRVEVSTDRTGDNQRASVSEYAALLEKLNAQVKVSVDAAPVEGWVGLKARGMATSWRSDWWP